MIAIEPAQLTIPISLIHRSNISWQLPGKVT
jgi:hypothetical protein